MTIHIPTWLIDAAYVLGIAVIYLLAVLGLGFIWFLLKFKAFK